MGRFRAYYFFDAYFYVSLYEVLLVELQGPGGEPLDHPLVEQMPVARRYTRYVMRTLSSDRSTLYNGKHVTSDLGEVLEHAVKV